MTARANETGSGGSLDCRVAGCRWGDPGGEQCECPDSTGVPRFVVLDVADARERIARALKGSRLMYGTHADRWSNEEWQDGFWLEAADVALATLGASDPNGGTS